MSRSKSFLVEAAVLVVVSACLALAGNALHARGIKLGRDYFPTGSRPRAEPPDRASVNNPAGAPAGNKTDPQNETKEKPAPDAQATDEPLPDHGLQVVNAEQAHRYFGESQEAGGLIVFVDARNDEEYADGHIPGALHVDHYQQDACLPLVRHLLEAAQVIIVYCQGGDCEDSIYLSNDLIYTHGFEYESVYLYEGGVEEWRRRGWPVETGPEP